MAHVEPATRPEQGFYPGLDMLVARSGRLPGLADFQCQAGNGDATC